MSKKLNTGKSQQLGWLGKVVLATGLMLGFTACQKSDSDNNPPYDRIQPKGPRPDWAPSITPQMQAVVETLDSLAPTPLITLSPQEARLQPTPTDAVMQVMAKYNIPMPQSNVDTMGVEIPVAGGQIHARVYKPRTGKASYPMIVYYHGGGWVIATIDTYNASAQALAEKVDAVVVSVEYRKGPEFKYPTAHNDAFAAYKWALANAASMSADSARVAVAGESAGGNLAVTTSMMARDSGVRVPLHQLSVYPIADNNTNSASYLQYAGAKPLNKPLMEWFFSHYLNNVEEGDQPWISLVDAANLSGLPPTTIIGAEIDPLQTEGKLLADRLTASGVPTAYRLYNGVVHEFFGMATVSPQASDAQNYAAQRLREALQ